MSSLIYHLTYHFISLSSVYDIGDIQVYVMYRALKHLFIQLISLFNSLYRFSHSGVVSYMYATCQS